MDTEKQKSFDSDVDAALELTHDVQNGESDAIVYQFPEHSAPEQPTQEEGEDSGVETAEQVADNSSTPEKRNKVREALSLGVVAAVALLAAPRPDFMTDNPEPPDSPTSLIEGSQQSAKMPFDPEKDESIGKVIRVKQNDPTKNTPSEAAFSSRIVKDQMASHPDQVTSLETSINSLPGSTEKIAIVTSRDVDGDGDEDTVAVPVK